MLLLGVMRGGGGGSAHEIQPSGIVRIATSLVNFAKLSEQVPATGYGNYVILPVLAA